MSPWSPSDSTSMRPRTVSRETVGGLAKPLACVISRVEAGGPPEERIPMIRKALIALLLVACSSPAATRKVPVKHDPAEVEQGDEDASQADVDGGTGVPEDSGLVSDDAGQSSPPDSGDLDDGAALTGCRTTACSMYGTMCGALPTHIQCGGMPVDCGPCAGNTFCGDNGIANHCGIMCLDTGLKNFCMGSGVSAAHTFNQGCRDAPYWVSGPWVIKRPNGLTGCVPFQPPGEGPLYCCP